MNRCWAFNKDGIRCELPSDHTTLHTMSVTWDDDECFSPIIHQLPQPNTEPEPPMTDISVPALPEPMPTPTGCIACGHKHAGGECRCGCYEMIG